jgi:hypothetical protein
MTWIFKTYNPEPKICYWMGFVVYSGPNLFKCFSDDIVAADDIYEKATGIDPCKPPKKSGIMITRFCPDLPCNQLQKALDALR